MRQGYEGQATKTIWNAFNWRDYRDDTTRLSMLEHGAYKLLMMEYYITGKPLPADALQLHYICRAHSAEECQAIASVLGNYFMLEEDGYHQKRIDLELATSRELRLKKQKAGNSRWNARAMQVHTQLHIQPHAHTQVHKIKSVVRTSFKIPSLEEVVSYCQERGSKIDPNHWFNHYASNGWKVGRNPMKDWRASIRYWETSRQEGNGQHSQSTKLSKSQQRDEEIRKSLENAFSAGAGGTDTGNSS